MSCKCSCKGSAQYFYEAPVMSERKELSMVEGFDSYCKKLRALLGADPDVTVLRDIKARVINICVAGCDKPEAYRQFFPGSFNLKGVGEVQILINGHKKTYKTISDENTLKAMFYNHPLVKEVKVTKFDDEDTEEAKSRLFVIFRNRTVQYVEDNLGSLWNATTTTAEALAKEVLGFGEMVVWYTTESDLSLANNIIPF